MALPVNTSKRDIKNLQMALNEKTGSRLTPDGDFGTKSVDALKIYQTMNGLKPDGDYGPVTRGTLEKFIAAKYLTDLKFKQAAVRLNVPVAVIKAFVEVEAVGAGFLPDGRPTILFERHKFTLYLAQSRTAIQIKELAQLNPNIVSTETGGYKGGAGEYDRLAIASAIDPHAALLATSWGSFQIMGFNHVSAGYKEVEAMVEDMKLSETFHLTAFVNFIFANPGIQKALQAKDWDKAALLYNGVNYKKNNYAEKLAASFTAFSKEVANLA